VGEATVIGFGVLALAGLLLVGMGALRRRRVLVLAGSAVLLGLAGAWVVGLPGVLAGVLPLGFLRRGSA
jgi:hypothetical protein